MKARDAQTEYSFQEIIVGTNLVKWARRWLNAWKLTSYTRINDQLHVAEAQNELLKAALRTHLPGTAESRTQKIELILHPEKVPKHKNHRYSSYASATPEYENPSPNQHPRNHMLQSAGHWDEEDDEDGDSNAHGNQRSHAHGQHKHLASIAGGMVQSIMEVHGGVNILDSDSVHKRILI